MYSLEIKQEVITMQDITQLITENIYAFIIILFIFPIIMTVCLLVIFKKLFRRKS